MPIRNKFNQGGIILENYKALLKEIKEGLKNRKTSHVHGSEGLILLRYEY